jgi:toxin YoeB
MRFVFTPNGWEDYVFWQTTDRATLKRINRLLDDIGRDPFSGIGKPSTRNTASSTSWRRTTSSSSRPDTTTPDGDSRDPYSVGSGADSIESCDFGRSDGVGYQTNHNRVGSRSSSRLVSWGFGGGRDRTTRRPRSHSNE